MKLLRYSIRLHIDSSKVCQSDAISCVKLKRRYVKRLLLMLYVSYMSVGNLFITRASGRPLRRESIQLN